MDIVADGDGVSVSGTGVQVSGRSERVVAFGERSVAEIWVCVSSSLGRGSTSSAVHPQRMEAQVKRYSNWKPFFIFQ